MLRIKKGFMKKLVVNPDKCIGCGLCVMTCGEVFAMGDDNKSYVKKADGCSTCDCQEAIDGCPQDAISWVEGE